MYEQGRAGLELADQLERNAEAVKKYQKAAEAGCVHASNNLANMYKKNRAGLELTPLARNELIISLYKQGVRKEHFSSAWNLAMFYKRQSLFNLAYSVFAIAIFLWDKKNQTEIEEINIALSNCPESQARQYALSCIQTCLTDDVSAQCHALGQFKIPSEYALFFDHDMNRFGQHSLYRHALFNQLAYFAQNTSTFSMNERVSLTQLFIKYISMQCIASQLKPVASAAHYIAYIKPYIDLMFNHGLHQVVTLLSDKDSMNSLAELSTHLLALVLVEPACHREFMVFFSKLVVNLPEQAAFWREPNLTRLLCLFFTQNQYTPMNIDKPLTVSQLKTLLMHLIERNEHHSNEDNLTVDTVGLQLLAHYKISFIDKEQVQLKARKVIDKYSALSTNALPILKALHAPNRPCINKLINELNTLIQAKEGHEVVVHLLALQAAVMSMPIDKYSELTLSINKLLIDVDMKAPIHKYVEFNYSYDGAKDVFKP